MPLKQRRAHHEPSPRIIIRLVVAVLVVLVFSALWLLDTGALLQVMWAQARANPRGALAIAVVVSLIIALSTWHARPKRRRASAKYSHKKQDVGS